MLPLEHELPLPADEQAVRVGFAQWEERAAESAPAVAEFMRALAADPADRKLLTSIFGNSPYLTQSLLNEPAFLMRLAKSGHRTVFAE
jgi:glutamate-ammonia-ligase adenylyltransferase